MLKPALTIGLTGGIGSGKSTVAKFFEDLGAHIIDTDAIAHSLTAAGGKAIGAIGAHFGKEFILANGAMDRTKMRSHVFTAPNEKKALEQILHPLIRQECEDAASKAQGAYLVFVVPLLVESGNWRDRVDRIVVVDCLEETQINRVIARNGLEREQIIRIMESQASRERRLSFADDVVNSEADLSHVHRQVEELHQKYLKFATQS
jgi:dephospho-CoA kinase